MVVRAIKEGITWVGAIDWDRRLFDALVPTPKGTSYNSYLIQGSSKTALIDTVDETMEMELVTNLMAENIHTIDYIIVSHTEQDHSGCIPLMLELYPGAVVLAAPKAKELLIEFFGIEENRVQVVEDGEEIDLGGKTLRFIHAPWVHWPDTMFTYIPEDSIIFTTDFLGSHLAASDLYINDPKRLYESAKRYYAEIMMPFAASIPAYLDTIENLDVDVIAPSHGPLYNNPDLILGYYRTWATGEPANTAVIAYVSMHGSTKKMVDILSNALIEEGVDVERFDLTVSDTGLLAMSLVEAKTIIIATPTVLFGAHPLAVYAAYLATAIKPKAKYATVIGSFGWGGKTIKQISDIIAPLKCETIDPVYIRGHPAEKDVTALKKLAKTVAAKHAE
ncbi:MAG: FprA family A-type flavoprotein [Methanocalculus sp. MSAO_Arc1]|uniref:FprA family A-type flavoprotein n=1 Tax=Methanocalculus TaxID=71151 RepID=UPI000FF261F8|nr:FprA family A-type flavoprotein [Methanocalculus sp. MSAO_Arc1]MCP1662156.1 flavorubredoxin [Methanocalculus sp. AMF5]RQD79113.1 MAG: FprA family A-type flavoprotein [Methanocalculus sp. MSAO_Arc1]